MSFINKKSWQILFDRAFLKMQYKVVMGKLSYIYKRFEILIPKSTLFSF
jgi:hypothetical protein